jgi:hypothetical protein
MMFVKKEGKKSQVTIFIILGILALVIIFGVLYYMNIAKNKHNEEILVEEGKIPSEIEPFVNYVESCLDTIAERGFLLLGSQGGQIYISQGGKSWDYTPSSEGKLFLKYNNYIAPYLIGMPLSFGDCKSEPPAYPIQKIPYPFANWLPSSTPSAIPTLPDISLPKEYGQEGCFGKSNPISQKAVISNLKSYIEKTMKSNCSFSGFTKFQINASEPKAEIRTMPGATKIILSYPIIAYIGNKKVVLKEFSANVKIGLSDLINFANLIMKKDIDDPTYDIKLTHEGYPFTINVVSNASKKQQFDDIIEIQSENVLLNGKPFKLAFARKNRPPALEYVYNVSFTDIKLERDFEFNWSDMVHQDFAAVDPDEDNATVKVWIGADLLKPFELTQKNKYQIREGDLERSELVIRVEASDGELSDWQEYIILK